MSSSEVRAAKINAFAVIVAALITGIGGTWLGSILESNKGQTTINQTFDEFIEEDENSDITLEKIKQNYIQLQSDYNLVEQQIQTLTSEKASETAKLTAANEKILELQSQSNQEIEDLKSQIEELESQLKSMPAFEFMNLSLCVDVDDIPINTKNSAVSIDGRDYFSRDIIENLIPKNKNLTIKDGTIFMGNVVADKASLFDMYVLDSWGFSMTDSATDSYNNNYSHVLYANTYGRVSNYIIYTLERKYSLLKISVAISSSANLNSSGILTIKADDKVIYTSKSLDKKMELLIEQDIPIENCNLLTIEYKGNSDHINCIIADAIVYN